MRRFVILVLAAAIPGCPPQRVATPQVAGVGCPTGNDIYTASFVHADPGKGRVGWVMPLHDVKVDNVKGKPEYVAIDAATATAAGVPIPPKTLWLMQTGQPPCRATPTNFFAAAIDAPGSPNMSYGVELEGCAGPPEGQEARRSRSRRHEPVAVSRRRAAPSPSASARPRRRRRGSRRPSRRRSRRARERDPAARLQVARLRDAVVDRPGRRRERARGVGGRRQLAARRRSGARVRVAERDAQRLLGAEPGRRARDQGRGGPGSPAPAGGGAQRRRRAEDPARRRARRVRDVRHRGRQAEAGAARGVAHR